MNGNYYKWIGFIVNLDPKKYFRQKFFLDSLLWFSFGDQIVG